MFFHRRFKIDKQLIASMRPTSKTSLKQMCLLAANGDLEKAQRLYDYMSKDLDDLPLFEPQQPTMLQQVKSGIGETMQWLSQNQDDIFVWVDAIKGMFGKNNNNRGGTASNAANIASQIPNPPINPIPNINS